MNPNFVFNVEINIAVFVLSIVFRVAASYFYARVVYFAVKEVSVKNGLLRLRKQLVGTSSLMFFINIAGLVLLAIRPFVNPYWFALSTNALSLLNSIGFFVVAWIKNQIYTQNYTPEMRDHHDIIDKLEKGEVKLVMVKKKGGEKH